MKSSAKGKIASRGAQAVALEGSESAAAKRNYLLRVMNCRRRAMWEWIELIKRCVKGWEVGDVGRWFWWL